MKWNVFSYFSLDSRHWVVSWKENNIFIKSDSTNQVIRQQNSLHLYSFGLFHLEQNVPLLSRNFRTKSYNLNFTKIMLTSFEKEFYNNVIFFVLFPAGFCWQDFRRFEHRIRVSRNNCSIGFTWICCYKHDQIAAYQPIHTVSRSLCFECAQNRWLCKTYNRIFTTCHYATRP